MSPRRGAMAVVLLLSACAAPAASRPPCPSAAPSAEQATDIIGDVGAMQVETSKGEFTISLQPDSAPVAGANFVALARCGFYDGISFHRVIPGFVAQAGDPQTRGDHGDFAGLGTGGPGYHFEVELPPSGTVYRTYLVAMANALQYDPATGEIRGGTDTNGSQFFVMLADGSLPPYFSVLGTVSDGTEVVDAIGQVPTSGDPMNIPLDPVIIESLTPVAGSGAS